MSSNEPLLVLPRPGTTTITTPTHSIPAPTESSFTSTFGALLPPATYLITPKGKAAYYYLSHTPTSPTPPPSNSSETSRQPERILLIHGVQTPALGLLPLARTLKSSFPSSSIVLLDLWGHGLSATPVAPHTQELFHDLLNALLEDLNWESAHFLGFSFGGVVAATYAVRTAERRKVESLILVAPGGFIRSSSFSPIQKSYLRAGEGVDENEVQDWVLEFLEGGALIVPSDWEERVARGEVVANKVKEWQMRNHEGHMASVVAMFRYGGVVDGQEVFRRAAGLGLETLVVLGEVDEIVSEGDIREAGFGNVVVVPGAGHGVVRERVPEVAKAVVGFWRQLR